MGRACGRRWIMCSEIEIKSGCPKCDVLTELYERTPQSPRDYWLMTELFVMLHDGDECPYAVADGGG